MLRALVFAAVLLMTVPAVAKADWPEGGVLVGSGSGAQTLTALLPDGYGGTYVAWADAGTGVRVKRLTPYGTTATGWPEGGALLTTGTFLSASSDGEHGVILLFVGPIVPDIGQGDRYRNYLAIRFASDGTTPSGWSAAGNVVGTESYPSSDTYGWQQLTPVQALPWSLGGSIFFVNWWRDPGFAGCHVFLVPSSGAPALRTAIALNADGGNTVEACPDSAGGFLVVRMRGDVVSPMRFTAGGALTIEREVYGYFSGAGVLGHGMTLLPRQDALVWCTNPYEPGVWHTRLGQNLMPVPGWPYTGWPSSLVNIPMTPLMGDGQGGLFASVTVSGTKYVDRRTVGTSTPVSLWSPGPLPLDHGGTYLSDGQAGYFEVWRQSATTTVRAVHYGSDGVLRTPWPVAGTVLTTTLQSIAAPPTLAPGGPGVAYAAWNDSRAGNSDVYLMRLADAAPTPAGVRPPEAGGLALRGFITNPSHPGDAVEFTLEGGRPAKLEVIDVAGRVLASEDVARLGAGTHRVSLASGTLRPGVVFLRLREGSHARTVRAVCVE